MPRNYFQRDGAAGVLAAGEAGWDTASDRIDQMMRKRASTRAAPKIATGDYGGAAEEYGAHGLAEETLAMRGRQDAGEADQAAAQAKAAEGRAKLLTMIAEGLEGVPEGERAAQLQKALPIFEQVGIDPGPFAQLTEDQLTTPNLRMFGAKVKEAAEEYTLAPGARRFKGSALVAENPVADPKPTIVPQGATALGPDGKPIFTNPKTFAPARPRSAGGGSGGGSLSGIKTEDLIAALRR